MSDRRLNGHAFGPPIVDPDTWGTPSTQTGRIKPKRGETAEGYADRQQEYVAQKLHLCNERRRRQKLALERKNARAHSLVNPPDSVVQEIERMELGMRLELVMLEKNGMDDATLRRVEVNRKGAIEQYWKAWYLARCGKNEEQNPQADMFEEE